MSLSPTAWDEWVDELIDGCDYATVKSYSRSCQEWRRKLQGSKGTMTKGQSEIRVHKYKRLSLKGYGLGNHVEPSRFKLANTTVVQRVYIRKETEHRPGCR
jgi:hypothetical protein